MSGSFDKKRWTLGGLVAGLAATVCSLSVSVPALP